jgi:hypothetical protein
MLELRMRMSNLNTGELLTRSILIFLSLIPLAESDMQTASLRGSLLYEQLAFRQITVNPQYFNFYRPFNISHILNALDVLQEFEILYSTLCKDIDLMPDLIPEFHLMKHEKNLTPSEACARMGGTLPEIKTLGEAKLLQSTMLSHGLTSIPAGISYIDNTLVYQSTREPIK